MKVWILGGLKGSPRWVVVGAGSVCGRWVYDASLQVR